MKVAPPDLIRVVSDDLAYLVEGWPEGRLGDAEIRRGSTVLRRLLTYKDLIRVWVTVAGPQDYVVPANYIRISNASTLRTVDFATVSPVQNEGMKIFNVVAYRGIRNGKDKAPFDVVSDEHLPLKQFIARPACIIQGVVVTRDDIVQFVANKMGGAHFDEERQKPSDDAIAALNAYQVGNRPALIHEMLACGQALAASPSTKALLSWLRK